MSMVVECGVASIGAHRHGRLVALGHSGRSSYLLYIEVALAGVRDEEGLRGEEEEVRCWW